MNVLGGRGPLEKEGPELNLTGFLCLVLILTNHLLTFKLQLWLDRYENDAL